MYTNIDIKLHSLCPVGYRIWSTWYAISFLFCIMCLDFVVRKLNAPRYTRKVWVSRVPFSAERRKEANWKAEAQALWPLHLCSLEWNRCPSNKNNHCYNSMAAERRNARQWECNGLGVLSFYWLPPLLYDDSEICWGTNRGSIQCWYSSTCFQVYWQVIYN